MAGDRIQINALERAASEDINDLQSMQARTLNDYFGSIGAVQTISNSGAPFDTLPQSWTLALDIRGTGSTVTVGPGTLSQLSLTHPATPGALESTQRLGINRADVEVVLPGTPNVLSLLEAQVVDVVTVSTTRDVFDVPTQTFIPTVVTKQVERRIQFQVVDGTATVIPAFTGNPWVPMYVFETNGSGQVNSLPTTLFLDLRQNQRALQGGLPFRSGAVVDHPDAVIESYSLHSSSAGAQIGGNFMGRVGGSLGWLKSDDGFVPTDDSAVSGAGNSLEHFYLMPLAANGITVMPVVQQSAVNSTSRGVLVRSNVQPGISGSDNGAAIAFDPGGTFQNFDTIGIHRAIHCGSAYVGQVNLATSGYVPFTQSSGGRNISRALRTGSPPPTVLVIFETGTAFAATFAMNLAAVLPNNARTAIIRVFGNVATNTAILQWERNIDAGQAFGPPMSVVVGENFYYEFEIPVHESSGDGSLNGMNWNLVVSAPGSPGTINLAVDVMGWSL